MAAILDAWPGDPDSTVAVAVTSHRGEQPVKGRRNETPPTTTRTFLIPMANLVRPSRDGDQFHYLWAARRCLSLLSPQTSLVGISIEGSSPNELQPIAAPLAGEELLDIAEYYGDEDVSRAQQVRYMQLKHSTRPRRRGLDCKRPSKDTNRLLGSIQRPLTKIQSRRFGKAV